MEWIFQLPLLFLSVIIHEVSHGWVAYLKGDDTAEQKGRLTLNPLAHIDPFGTVFLPLLCHVTHMPMFGWAKPVPVNQSRLAKGRRDMMAVAFAGPGANLVLALAMAVAFKAFSLASFLEPGLRRTFLDAMLFGVSVNLFLAFFNLLPVHPLDGAQVLAGLLPQRWRAGYYRHAPYGFVIILGLLFTRLVYPLVVIPSNAFLALFTRAGLLW